MMKIRKVKNLKNNGNRISINVYGIHKDIKKQCEDILFGDYVNNIDGSRQVNNINKNDELLITENDYYEIHLPNVYYKKY